MIQSTQPIEFFTSPIETFCFIKNKKETSSNNKKNKFKKNTKTTISLEQFHKSVSVTQPLTRPSSLDKFDPLESVKRPDPKDFFKYYNGTISNKTSKCQYVKIRDVSEKLLFSQTTVSDFNYDKIKQCDYPIDNLADAMFIEFKKEPLDVVDMGEGYFTSVDNRRLLIAKKISVIDRTYGIWVRVHSFDETLSKGLQKRFGGVATWGEAVKKRIANEEFIGYSDLPTIMTVNKLEQRVKAISQTIPLLVDCDLSKLHTEDKIYINETKKNDKIYI